MVVVLYLLALLFSPASYAIVNHETGSSHFTHNDIEHRLIPITRVYNSFGNGVFSFGINQSTLWDTRLKVLEDKIEIIYMGMGQKDFFKKEAGRFVNEKSEEIILKGKIFVLNSGSFSKYSFNSKGFLSKIEKNGKEVLFKRDKKNRVRSILVDGQKLYSLSYNYWNFISAIEVFKNKISYKYDKYKRLSRVTLNGRPHYRYEYTDKKYAFISKAYKKEKLFSSYEYDKKSSRVKKYTQNSRNFDFQYEEIDKKRTTEIKSIGLTSKVSTFIYHESILGTPVVEMIESLFGANSTAYGVNKLPLRRNIYKEKYDYIFDKDSRLISRKGHGINRNYSFDEYNRLKELKMANRKVLFQYKDRFSNKIMGLNVDGRKYNVVYKEAERLSVSFKEKSKTLITLIFDDLTTYPRYAKVHGEGVIEFFDYEKQVVKLKSLESNQSLLSQFNLLRENILFEEFMW